MVISMWLREQFYFFILMRKEEHCCIATIQPWPWPAYKAWLFTRSSRAHQEPFCYIYHCSFTGTRARRAKGTPALHSVSCTSWQQPTYLYSKDSIRVNLFIFFNQNPENMKKGFPGGSFYIFTAVLFIFSLTGTKFTKNLDLSCLLLPWHQVYEAQYHAWNTGLILAETTQIQLCGRIFTSSSK